MSQPQFRSTTAPGRFIGERTSTRSYSIYIPTGYSSQQAVPLLVMLHGCNQTPEVFAASTEMNRYAEQHTFIVVYPAQPASANQRKCWNWFQQRNQQRGLNEPAEIVQIVEQVTHDYTIDQNRIYVAGLSAGAAMVAILGATYPDVFAAIGICSGLGYRAATNTLTGIAAMLRGGPAPDIQARAAYQAMGKHKRVVPVIVVHGTADRTVTPSNADQVVLQWLHTNRLAAHGAAPDGIALQPAAILRSTVPGGRSYTEYRYTDHNDRVIIKKYLVEGMRHRWSGGVPGGSYTDPKGPQASALITEFLLQQSLVEPVPIPVVPEEQAVLVPAPAAPAAKPGWWQRIRTTVGRLGGRIVRLIRGNREK